MEQSLDRTLITGQLSISTPSVVVEEVASSLGVVYDRSLLSDLYYRVRIDTTLQAELSRRRAFKRIPSHAEKAFFINPDRELKWTREQVSAALSWLGGGWMSTCEDGDHSSSNASSSIDIDHRIVHRILALTESDIGNPTPLEPRRVTVSILYRVARELGCITTHSTSIAHMMCFISTAVVPSSSIIDEITSKLASLGRNELLHIASALNVGGNDDKQWKPCQEHLLTAFNDLEKYGESPVTNDQAVIAAAVYKRMDLSWSPCPLLDYRRLIIGMSLSPRIARLMKVTSSSLSLSSFFNLNLPPNVYSKSDIDGFKSTYSVQRYGDVNDVVFESMVDTFYDEVHPGVDSLTTSVFLTDVEEVELWNPSAFISYGSYSTSFSLFTVDELYSTFNSYNSFRNPKGGIFTDKAIKRLVEIVMSKRLRAMYFESHETLRADCNRLLDKISLIDIEEGSRAEHVRHLIRFFKSSEGSTQELMRAILFKLRDAALFMRGWNGTDTNLPIAFTTSRSDEEINENVWRALLEYEAMCTVNEEAGSLISSLPLYYYSGSDFTVVTSKDGGVTIQGRINIVKKGSTISNISSCIRLSSNTLLFTCHVYITSLGEKAGFNPGDVAIVS